MSKQSDSSSDKAADVVTASAAHAVEVEQPTTTEAVASPVSLSVHQSITLIAHGVFMPAVLLGMSLCGINLFPDQPWQSGRVQHYVVMLLRPVAWGVFLPGLLYSMFSLTLWVIEPANAKRLWVRMGICTGVVLSFHFWLLLMTIFHVPMLITGGIVWLIWHALLWAARKVFQPRRQFHIWHILVGMTVVAILVVVIQQSGGNILYMPASALFGFIMASPVLNVIAYSYAAARVSRTQTEGSKAWWPAVGVLVAWLVAWLASWRYAVLVMLDEYSKLPTTDPNCYLANSAAYAHPCLTGSTTRGQVTDCMRRLKFIELVFKAVLPDVHRLVRRYYDRYCPPLAVYCQQHFWLATLTCLALKPLEIAAVLLRLVLRIPVEKVTGMYQSRLSLRESSGAAERPSSQQRS